jgi:AcrR family transcriptional regulator
MTESNVLQSEKKLPANQSAALNALLAGSTIRDAADAVGVNESTVFRWLKSDEFSTALRAQSADAIRRASWRLAGAIDEAITVLLDVATGRIVGRGASTRVRAADLLLGHAQRFHEMSDITERLAALEAKIDQQIGTN